MQWNDTEFLKWQMNGQKFKTRWQKKRLMPRRPLYFLLYSFWSFLYLIYPFLFLLSTILYTPFQIFSTYPILPQSERVFYSAVTHTLSTVWTLSASGPDQPTRHPTLPATPPHPARHPSLTRPYSALSIYEWSFRVERRVGSWLTGRRCGSSVRLGGAGARRGSGVNSAWEGREHVAGAAMRYERGGSTALELRQCCVRGAWAWRGRLPGAAWKGREHGAGAASMRRERDVSTAREQRERGVSTAWEQRQCGVRGAWARRGRLLGAAWEGRGSGMGAASMLRERGVSRDCRQRCHQHCIGGVVAAWEGHQHGMGGVIWRGVTAAWN